MAQTPTPLHYYDLGSGQFDETSTYPFTGATPDPTVLRCRRNAHQLAAVRDRCRRRHARWLGPAPAVGNAHGRRVTSPGRHLGTSTGSARFRATGDTLIWSPSGAPCGRPIDQWSMGGISVPSGTAGLLGPCVNDDRVSETGPWATSYTSAPFAHPETVAGPITATVYASSTTSETELVAELEDVTPSGAAYPLTEGALLGSLRAVDKKRPGRLTA